MSDNNKNYLYKGPDNFVFILFSTLLSMRVLFKEPTELHLCEINIDGIPYSSLIETVNGETYNKVIVFTYEKLITGSFDYPENSMQIPCPNYTLVLTAKSIRYVNVSLMTDAHKLDYLNV